MTRKNGVPDQALPELKLTRVQRSSLVIIAHARREGPGDEATLCVLIHCVGILSINSTQITEYAHKQDFPYIIRLYPHGMQCFFAELESDIQRPSIDTEKAVVQYSCSN